VRTANGLFFNSAIVARDKKADTAILQLIEPKGYVADFLTLGRSKSVDTISDVHVIGHPLHTSNQIMSSGKITGFVLDYAAKVDRKLVNVASTVPQNVGWRTGTQVLQIPVMPGSSGSHVVNGLGEVIGMVCNHNEFKSYAIAVEHLKELSKEADLTKLHPGVLDVRTYYWRTSEGPAAQTIRSKLTGQLDRAQRLLGSRVFPNNSISRLETFRTIVDGEAR
jgi:hypothetical protein